MHRPGLLLVSILLLSSSLSGCGGGGAAIPANAPSLTAAQQTTPTRKSSSVAQSMIIGIDAGGGAAGSGWVGDTDYSGGGTSATTAPVNTNNVNSPAPQAVYLSQRYGGTFQYAIPSLTANAAYTVRLHFAETFFTAPNQRVFNVAINGVRVLSNFDIFAAAGGANVALVESFNATADATGTITVAFTSSVNYPSVAGIEIDGQAKSTGPAYPIYSSAFTGNSPFHHTVAQLMAAGATIRSSNVANNYWAQGIGQFQPGSQTGGVGPLYTAHAGDPSYAFSCPAYGTCNANGVVVHLPAGAYAETGGDHHLSSFDPVYLKGEVDGWGGDGHPGQGCNLAGGGPGRETCSWGGFFPFSGNGLATDSSSANAGGYAFGIMDITAQELLQGHIDHAIGIEQSCLDNYGVYPAIVGRTTDSNCPSYLEPNVRYGDLIHLKSAVNVDALGYSPYCRVIAQALQTYGAYTSDSNGGWGIALTVEYMDQYSGANPWYQTIFPSMVAGGDGSGSGSNFQFPSCLQRIHADDIEVIEISPNLPNA